MTMVLNICTDRIEYTFRTKATSEEQNMSDPSEIFACPLTHSNIYTAIGNFEDIIGFIITHQWLVSFGIVSRWSRCVMLILVGHFSNEEREGAKHSFFFLLFLF